MPLAPDCLLQRPLDISSDREPPRFEVRSPTGHPFVFRKRLGHYERTAQPGDLVRLETSSGETHGYGLFNSRAEMTVRQLTWGEQVPDPDWWERQLARAVMFRREFLGLDAVTDAYRVVHAEGDGLSGLIVDRLADVLVVEAYSLGMYQRAEAVLDILTPLCETTHGLLRPAPQTLEHEGFTADPIGSEKLPEKVTVREFGTRFRVEFSGGHKTGFYCDQRENRRRFAGFCANARVLDLCCYTGGFSVQSKVLGQARDVIGVELDEQATELARQNAKLNKAANVQFVQADVFTYARDMLRNERQFDAIVVDPPKLIRTSEEMGEARGKYFDLNRLAFQLAAPGALILTCSCSGRMSSDEFTRLVMGAANNVGRSVRLFDRSGAAGDHPVAANCLESDYLKALWLRVE